MADVYNIEETREVQSVLYDQLTQMDLTAVRTTDADMEAMITKVKTGLHFVIGQVVTLQSTTGVIAIGGIPAIVTKITRVHLSKYEYELTILSGDLNDEFVKVTLSEDKVEDAISIIEDMTVTVTAIKDSKLGKPTLRDLKLLFTVEHLFIYDTTTEKLNSIF